MDQIVFCLEETTAVLFDRWLQDYIRTKPSTFYKYGRWFSLQSGKARDHLAVVELDAIELPLTAKRWLGKVWRKRRLSGIIRFEVEQTHNDKIRVAAACRNHVADEYFRRLLLDIAQRWPSAARPISQRFPQVLPEPSSLERLALLKVNVADFGQLLNRLADEFTHDKPQVTGVEVSSDYLPRVPDHLGTDVALIQEEVVSWIIAIKTLQEFRPFRSYLGKVISEEMCDWKSVYLYPFGGCKELFVSTRPTVWKSDDLFSEFFGRLMQELKRFGAVTSEMASINTEEVVISSQSLDKDAPRAKWYEYFERAVGNRTTPPDFFDEHTHRDLWFHWLHYLTDVLGLEGIHLEYLCEKTGLGIDRVKHLHAEYIAEFHDDAGELD